ncbi:MAG: hypothetical protein ACYDDF_07115 [Thermoplasmatota archaeon]
MAQERPAVEPSDVCEALESETCADNGRDCLAWVGGRTILARYAEYEDEIYVYSVSARRQPP